MAPKSSLVKVSVFMTRKENTSEADFHQYWTQRHSKVASEWLQKHNVVKYTQQKAKASISALPDASYASYDGIVELLMKDEKSVQDALEDPYYKSVVKPDEEVFIDTSKSRFQFGWEEVYIEEGKLLSYN